MGTVQFREDDEVIAYLRAEGMNPNEFARDLLEAWVRRSKAQKRMDRLRASAVDLGDVVRLVREDRDSR